MQRLEVSGAVRPIYGSLGVKRLIRILITMKNCVQGVCSAMLTTHIWAVRRQTVKERVDCSRCSEWATVLDNPRFEF